VMLFPIGALTGALTNLSTAVCNPNGSIYWCVPCPALPCPALRSACRARAAAEGALAARGTGRPPTAPAVPAPDAGNGSAETTPEAPCSRASSLASPCPPACPPCLPSCLSACAAPWPPDSCPRPCRLRGASRLRRASPVWGHALCCSLCA
jgi:hypothetical protein